jgi:hypothetical protein
VRLAPVRDLSNDLDNNVCVGALRVDIGDADLGVVEIELLDPIVDSLLMKHVSQGWVQAHGGSYLLTHANVDLILFSARDEL